MKRFLVLALILAFAAPLWAQKTATITITDNNNPPGTRYFVYHRLGGGNYVVADRRDAGTSKVFTWTIAAPVPIGTHYWSVTAYVPEGTNNIESGYSNEISWLNPPVPVTITLTNIAAITTRKEAILSAEANMGSKATLEYKMAGGWWQTKPVDGDYAKLVHTTQLTNLRPHTGYEYRWIVTSEDGQTAEASGNFTTK